MVVKQLGLARPVADSTQSCTNRELIVCTVNEGWYELCLYFLLGFFKNGILYTASKRILLVLRNLLHIVNHRAVHLEQFGLSAQIWLTIVIVLTSRYKCIRCTKVYCVGICVIRSTAHLPFRNKKTCIIQNLYLHHVEGSIE